jgi:hypothetical protein
MIRLREEPSAATPSEIVSFYSELTQARST